MYDRVVSCAKAVLALVQLNQAEEGFIIGRSMFEDTLRLLQIEEAGEQRAAFLLGWFNVSYERLRDVFGRDDPSIQEHTRRMQAEIQTAMGRLGISRLLRFLPPKEAANRFHLTDEYKDYVFAHEVVHGGELAHRLRRGRLGGGKNGMVVLGEAQLAEFRPACAIFATKMLLLSTRAIATIIQGVDSAHLTALSARASRLAVALLE
jgi:hypothetical protein